MHVRYTVAALLLLAAVVARAADHRIKPLLVSTQENFTFAVCGDNREGDATYLQILAAVSNSHAAFLINTGDLVPHGSEENWNHFDELMKNCTVPFFPVAGNHDLGEGGMKRFKRLTPTHSVHYSIDYGLIHFTMINDATDMDESELLWMEKDLKETDKPVKVVVHHMPAWSPDGDPHGMQHLREPFLKMLDKYHVNFDLCGHDHGFRTGRRNQTTVVVTGGAGARLYHAENEGGFHHYVEFTVKGTNVTFKPIPIKQ
jgi:Icc-related predicted phosphoesterase